MKTASPTFEHVGVPPSGHAGTVGTKHAHRSAAKKQSHPTGLHSACVV
jgi:hypothetical protein